MTSDAKIGLLLGLVFIFVIAFVINGLPSFRAATNNSELTTNMVSSQNEAWGIGTSERKVQEGFDWTGQPIEGPVAEPLEEVTVLPEDTEDIRFEMPIPENIAIVEDISHELTPELVRHTLAEAGDPPDQEPPAVGPIDSDRLEKITFELPPVEKTPRPEKPESPKWAEPKVYTVCEGDTLASIAKKFYGPEEGNKIANNMKIFEANRKILKSPHELKIGQKIVVPPLDKTKPKKNKSESTFAGSLFEQAKSIGRKLLPAADKPAEQPKTKPTRKYVVKDGDYLWKVAEKQLGDPIRYKEIVKLNPGVLKDENTTLQIGMSLNLPTK
ncbi:MAG: LysM peptidoglycan-binding domain-containing protein [Phycisphaerales bacterium]|nr:MAG: LysM peptidoglycan-binding domain-containing protein [Phycisphaerales bacterium]